MEVELDEFQQAHLDAIERMRKQPPNPLPSGWRCTYRALYPLDAYEIVGKWGDSIASMEKYPYTDRMFG
jgi:hypothetical protein